jgi:hypothetical protein
MSNRTTLPVLLLLACVVFSGCPGGGPAAPDVYPVTGTVRLDGEPVGGVSISFAPLDAPGGGGFAVSDTSGKFSLRSKDQREGVPAGKYRVLCTKMAMPDGSPIPEGQMAADVGAENSLPAIYSDPANTPLTAEVKAAENPPLEFDLQSAK